MNHPKNYQELVQRLSTQEACLDYIASIRWPAGFVCPKCGCNEYWTSKQLQRICTKCKHQLRVLAGTLFQDTKLPLTLWFQMIWWFVGPKNGASALSLMQNFGIGSYRTSWMLLGKLRSCAVLPMRQALSGQVEVDEAFLGGKNNKEVIAVAAEKRGKATGRIRLKHLQSREGPEIQDFISQTIVPGSTIISDRFKSYPAIVKKGYLHDPQKKPYFWEEVDGDDERLLPRVHRVISLLKRWYYGTYQGRVAKESLQTYLDEFVFRFNRRTSGNRGLLFHRMVEATANAEPKPH
ncbi:MAG: IS1595 family transposase [Myxococcaceae bacterium]